MQFAVDLWSAAILSWLHHQEIGEEQIIHYNHWRGFDKDR